MKGRERLDDLAGKATLGIGPSMDKLDIIDVINEVAHAEDLKREDSRFSLT